MYDATSGDLLADLPVGAMSNQVVAWHPDGERLAVAGSDPRIQIWNVAAKRKVATLEGHVQHVPALTFHPDGDLLASHSWDGMLRLWDPSTGRPLLQLAPPSATVRNSARDGRWLGVAWHGEQADLLEVTPNREYRTLVSSAGAGMAATTAATSARTVACWPWAWTQAPVCGTCAAAGSSPRCPQGPPMFSSTARRGQGGPVRPDSPRWRS